VYTIFLPEKMTVPGNCGTVHKFSPEVAPSTESA
jgi:hypothetical protein